ncbi:MAG: ABC transporter ATP-binding protein [Candidatus Thorarchaeota archaeon]
MLLECKDLIKIYSSPVEGLNFPALRGLHFSLRGGEMVSIIGPSGAGKTTLFRLISAYDRPSSGEIWFEGDLINQFSEAELSEYRKKIGIMYQSPRENLVWGMNALDNVLFPMRYSGRFIPYHKQRARDLLKRVGLKGKESRKPAQLSGGEQQRVALAVALANEPSLLLADEPTGELDSVTTSVIIDYFKELNEELGVTICVATHDHRFSTRTDLTYQIQDGRLTAYQSQKEGILSSEEREEMAIIDSNGNIRLPDEVLKHFEGVTSAKVVVKKDKIELVNLSSDQKKKKVERDD